MEFMVTHYIRRVSQGRRKVLMGGLFVPYLFTRREAETKSDIERLMLVLGHLPDEGLMRKLEEQRKWGRDDYPIGPVWNSVLVGIVYQYQSLDSLRGEILRKGELRERCGFDPLALKRNELKKEYVSEIIAIWSFISSEKLQKI